MQKRKPLYRNRRERKKEEAERGGKTRSDNWFREAGFTSTLSVLPTPNGQLAELAAVAMASCPPPKGTKTKVLERGGTTAQQQLVSSNPYPKDECGRVGCGMCCEKPSRGLCYKPSVGYKYTCTRCEMERELQIEDGIPVDSTTSYKYIGESSRTPYTRHLQHISKYRSKYNNRNKRKRNEEEDEDKNGTFMWSHTRDHHGGMLGPDAGAMDYSLEVEGIFRDTMSRQIDEDVRMRNCGWGDDALRRNINPEPTPKCILMNGKSEYFKPKIIETIFKQW